MSNSHKCNGFIDLEISDTDGFDGSRIILKQLRPSWSADDIQFKVFTEGYSNRLIACMHKDDVDTKRDVVLVRIYGRGSEMFIDRNKERQNMVLLNSVDSAAPLYGSFKNGVVYGYTPGDIVTYDHVCDKHIQRLVCRELAKLHCIDHSRVNQILGDGIHFDENPSLFSTLNLWLSLLPQTFTDPQKQIKFESIGVTRAYLKQEVDCLSKILPHNGSPVVLCHNDLLFNNIIYDEKKDRVTFIDFEYTAFSYQAYDISNHFCEFADMETLDFSRYPSKEYQLSWLRMFLEEYKKGQNESPESVTDKDVERIYVQVNQYSLAAHLFWSLWACVQAEFSLIDYDYLHFATERLAEYRRRKDEFLSLKLPD